jgi:tetratricopeptide (TPR) repeat protein
VDLAHRMRELREEAGLTKTALARPGYTVGYVTQIEKGLRTPSSKALSFFAAKLGVTPEYLATGVPEDLEESLRYQLEEIRQALRDGRADQVETTVRPVLAQAEQFGLLGIRSEAEMLLGQALAMGGHHREAVEAFEDALGGELAMRDEGMTVGALARSYRAVGDLTYASQIVETYLDTRRDPPLDTVVVGHLQNVLLSVYFERGDVLRAERAARRALAAAEGSPPEVQAAAYWNASRVLAEAKRWDEALDYATRARVITEQADDRRGVARLHNVYAFICLDAEPPRTEEASWHLDRAEILLADGVGSPGDLAYVRTERARLALIEERPEEAVTTAEKALTWAGDDPLETARCLFLKGRGLSALGRREEAEADFSRAAVLFGELGARQQEASCWREIGDMFLDAGDVDRAVRALRSGLEALDPRRTRA